MLEHLVSAASSSDAKHGGKQRKGAARRPRDEEEALLQGMNRDLDSIAMRMDGDDGDGGDGDANAGVESIARDLSSLSRAKRLELLMADAPELAPLAEDLKKRWAEIRDELVPALAMLRESYVSEKDNIIAFSRIYFCCVLQLVLFSVFQVVFFLSCFFRTSRRLYFNAYNSHKLSLSLLQLLHHLCPAPQQAGHAARHRVPHAPHAPASALLHARRLLSHAAQ
jgi:hypothetical protein